VEKEEVNLSGLLKASSSTFMTTVVIMVVGFFTSVVTARILGPEGRGLLSGALLIATLAGNAALFGLANTFVYHKGAQKTFNYRAFFVFSLLFIGILSAILSYFGLQLSSEVQLHEQLTLVIIMAVVSGGYGYFSALSQLNHELHFFNLMRVSLVIGNLLLLGVIVLVFKPVTFVQILVSQIIVSGALMAWGIGWANKHRIWHKTDSANADTLGWSSMLGYGIKHHGTVLLGILLVNFDKLVLLKMGTITEYGFYALAFTTSRLIGAVQEATSTALYARHAGKDVQQLSQNVNHAFRLTFLPMLLIAAVGAFVSPWLIPLVYGEAFTLMAIPFAILLFECVIGGASWTLAQRFNAGGRPGLVFFRQFISVVPVFAALPFLPHEHIHIYLSGLMLLGAILRLAVTLGIYPVVLSEPMPRMWPYKTDVTSALKLLARK
jgi:antigen flippase